MATSTGSKRKLSVNIEALEANNTLTLGGNGVATQSWVNSQLSGLVDSAPSTLDTLNELAAALGDDPNFATTITNSVATKLPLAGGTLTGALVLDHTNPSITFKGDDGIWYRARVDESGNQLELGHTTNIGLKLSNSGGVTFPQYGAGFVKTNANGVVSIDSNSYLTQTDGDARYLQSLPAHNHIGVHPYIDSSTADSRGPDFDALLPDANQSTYKEVHAINEGTNIPTGAYTYGVVQSTYMTSMKLQWYVPHTASRGNSNTQDTIYFRTNWGSGNWYGWKYLIHSGNIAGQSVNYANSAGTANAVTWANVSGKPSTFAPSSHNHDDRYYTESESDGRYWRLRSISLTGSNPFDNSHTETQVSGNGNYLVGYTGASAQIINSVTGGSAGVFQIGAHYNGTDFYMRTRTDSANWRDWRKLWHNGNLSNVSQLSNDSGYLTSIPSEYLTQTEGDARYLTDLPNAGIGAGTYGSTSNQTKIDTITVDAKGRVTAVATGTGGDITAVRLVDDAGSYVQDTGGTAVLTIAGGAGITTSASGTTITVTNSEAGEADAVRTELDARITANSTDIARNATDIATKAAAGGSYGQDFTADDMRVDQWFRNTVSGKGLYNDATANHWYSDSSSRWRIRSGSSTEAWLLMGTSNNATRGSFYANSSNHVGILDANNEWAVKVVHDSHVELRDNNETVFTAGQGGHSSNYGTVCTHGNGRGGWEGYSINGRFVWMSSDSSMSGMYNDTDNEWMTQYHRNGAVKLYHNGGLRLETQSGGAKVTGTMTATAFVGDGSALTGISAGAPPVAAFVEGGEESTLSSITFDPGTGTATFTLADGSSFRLAFAR